MKKATLITSFPPNIGGGAVILHSLVQHFKEVNVTWLYLHEKDIKVDSYFHIGKPLMGGYIWKDLLNCLPLWLRFRTKELKKIIAAILAFESDIYWVVGHNEGLLIAQELALATNTPVHFTVHDDTPYGMFARSRRYGWLSRLAQRRLVEAVGLSQSIDVVSEAMGHYYRQTLGIDSIIVHRYVPYLQKLEPAPLNPDKLVVGHIGSIYSLKEFRLFCQAVKDYAQKSGRTLQLLLIGIASQFIPLLQEFSEFIVDFPQLSEEEAIKQLSQCHFVYAMYPFAEVFTVFRQTSLPTKLSTYIQVQRPIFAHTPEDSTLSMNVKQYKLGIVCNSLSTSDLTKNIEAILSFKVEPNNFEKVRTALHGIDNVERMENLLSSQPVRLLNPVL